MAIDSRFKLQTMEKGLPSIVITKNGIFLSKNLHKKLNDTKFIQVYLSKETKEIAIVKCNELDDSAVELKINGDYARIYNKDFINNIASICNKSLDNINLRIIGTYIPEDDYFIFDLSTTK